jgi:hypothetical protein
VPHVPASVWVTRALNGRAARDCTVQPCIWSFFSLTLIAAEEARFMSVLSQIGVAKSPCSIEPDRRLHRHSISTQHRARRTAPPGLNSLGSSLSAGPAAMLQRRRAQCEMECPGGKWKTNKLAVRTDKEASLYIPSPARINNVEQHHERRLPAARCAIAASPLFVLRIPACRSIEDAALVELRQRFEHGVGLITAHAGGSNPHSMRSRRAATAMRTSQAHRNSISPPLASIAEREA